MARPKKFDKEQALDAAIDVFREHGFEGTSTELLVKGMKIGRQSLYDTFGDKWRLYCAALSRYAAAETQAHIDALNGEACAIDGFRAMIERVVADAKQACLGVNSVCEFGQARPELAEINGAAERRLNNAVVARACEGQAAGEIPNELAAEDIAGFLSASLAGIRIAARGGAGQERLRAMGQLALRALR